MILLPYKTNDNVLVGKLESENDIVISKVCLRGRLFI